MITKGEIRSSLKSDFIKKIVETYLTQIITLGISFLSIIIFSRTLGPTARGMLATATAMAALGVQFGNVGLHASNTYFIAKDRKLLSVIVGNSCLVSICLGTLIMLLIIGGYFVNPVLIPINGWILFLSSLLIPLGLTHLLFQNIFLGIQEIRTYNKIEIIVKSIVFIFVCTLFACKIKNVETILCVNLFASILGIYFSWRKLRGEIQEKLNISREFLKCSFAYGIRSYVAAFFAFLVIRIDLLMVKYILGFEQAGFYSIVATIGDLFCMFPIIIGTLLLPKLISITDEQKRFQIVKKVAVGVLGVMTILALGCVFTAKPLIGNLLGEPFLPAVPALLWLLPGLILLSVNVIFMNYLASIGLPWITMFSPGFAAFINILMNLKMIPSMGILGASLSSSIAYSCMLIINLIYLYTRMKWRSDAVSHDSH